MSSLRIVDLWVLFLWILVDGIVVFRRGAGAVSRDDRFSMQAIVLATWVGLGVAIYFGFAGTGGLGAHRVLVQLFGLGLGSWLSAAFLLVMALLAYAYRIHVEEKALLDSLGDAHAAYSKRTYRLIPGVY